MNTLKHISLFVTLAATALLAACSDKDDYTPGPEVAQGCQQVRFLATNTADCILDAADESIRSTTITLKRNNDGAALTMPIIIVSKDEGLEIPTEVTFPTGQSTAQITIKTPQQVKLGDSFAYEIKIEGDNIDPYAKLDGGATFAGTVNYPKKRKLDFWFDSSSAGRQLFDVWTETLMDLGNGRYYIIDFMHSGESLWFTVNDNKYVSIRCDAWPSGSIQPDEDYPGCNYYYFQKLVNGNVQAYPLYPSGKEDGKPYIVTATLFGGPGYSPYNIYEDGDWGKIYAAEVMYNDKSIEKWVNINFQFQKEENP